MRKADYALFFTARGCSGCEHMKPVMEKLYKEGYRIRFIDFNKERRTAVSFRVTSVPTTILRTNNGVEVKRWVGRVREEEIKKNLNHDEI